MSRPRHATAVCILATIALLTTSGFGQEAPEDTDPPPVALRFDSFNVGEVYWFEEMSVPGRNPEIALEPGVQHEVTLYNRASERHNLHFADPLDQGIPILEPTRQDTITFTVPAEAEGEGSYWCDLHRDLGMNGTVVFAAPGPGPNLQLPGPAMAAVLLGLLVLCVAVRRPPSV